MMPCSSNLIGLTGLGILIKGLTEAKTSAYPDIAQTCKVIPTQLAHQSLDLYRLMNTVHYAVAKQAVSYCKS